MKRRLLHNIGDFFIAFACIITAGFLAERQNEWRIGIHQDAG